MAEYTCCSSVAFERPNENTFTFTLVVGLPLSTVRSLDPPHRWLCVPLQGTTGETLACMTHSLMGLDHKVGAALEKHSSSTCGC